MISTAEKQELLEILNPYRASAASARCPRYGAREVQYRQAHQRQRQEADGEGPEGVLPQREDQGHPSGARTQGRPYRRAGGAQGAHRGGRPAKGSSRRRPSRSSSAWRPCHPVSAEATVSRNYIDWLVSVPWKKRSRELKDLVRARRDSGTRTTTAWTKIKERILEFLAVRQLTEEDPELDHLLRGAPGCRKVLVGQIDRQSDGSKVRSPVPRRCPGRGGDPRPSAHLHRCLPGSDHPDDEEGRHGQSGVPARRDREDVDGLPRRSFLGSARGARSGAERCLRRSLPRRRVRPLQGHVHRHGQRQSHDPAGLAGPDGGHPAHRLHAEREARDRPAAFWCRAARGARSRARADRASREGLQAVIESYTREAGVRSLEREIAQDLPQGRPPVVGRGQRGDDRGDGRDGLRAASARSSSGLGARARSPRSVWRPVSPGPRPAASCSRPRSD